MGGAIVRAGEQHGVRHPRSARREQGAGNDAPPVAAPAKLPRRPDTAQLHRVGERCIERGISDRRARQIEDELPPFRLQAPDLVAAIAPQLGRIDKAERFAMKRRAPVRHQVDLCGVGMAHGDAPLGQSRRDMHRRDLQREQIVDAVLGGLRRFQTQREAGAHHLLARSREPEDLATGSGDDFRRQQLDQRRRLDQQHAVPAMAHHADDRVAIEGGNVGCLIGLAAIDEPNAA